MLDLSPSLGELQQLGAHIHTFTMPSQSINQMHGRGLRLSTLGIIWTGIAVEVAPDMLYLT